MPTSRGTYATSRHYGRRVQEPAEPGPPSVRPRDANGRLFLALAACALTAAGVVAAGLSPTGSSAVDVPLVAAAAVVAIRAGAVAPWWMVAAGGVVVAATSTQVGGLVLGALAAATAVAVRVLGRAPDGSGVVPAALVVVGSAHLGAFDRFGLSSAVGVGVAVVLAMSGVVVGPRRRRWFAVAFAGGLAILAAAAVAAFASAASSAREPLEGGGDLARRGAREFADGDVDAARGSFRRATALFEEAAGHLDGFWSKPSLLVPGVAQNRRAIGRVLRQATRSMGVVASTLERIDLEALRPANGRIDVDAIAALEPPLAELNATLGRLVATAAVIDRDPWVVRQLTDRLGDLMDDVDAQRARGEDVLRVVRTLPGVLGIDEPRVYFVAFLTPAELRGAGGVMETWAEITVDRGRISMTDVGRAEELDAVADAAAAVISGPQEWLEHWGRYGIVDADGTVTPVVWSNVTVSPHFPDTAQVISELYPISGGRPVDGVLALDIRALATLLSITGPVGVPGLDEPLTAATAEQYLLRDQYLRAADGGEAAADAVETLAPAVVLDLLAAPVLPEPTELIDLFGPLVEDRRIQMWAVRPEEEVLFEQAGMDGALPNADDLDCSTYALTNEGGDEIDGFLDVDPACEQTTDPATGAVTTTVTMRFTNSVPTLAIPDDVPANALDQPPGANRLSVSVYARGTPTSVVVDGSSVDFAADVEHGLGVARRVITVPSGAGVDLVVVFA